MSKNSKDYVAYLSEQLAELPDIAVGRFFGGTRLSSAGIQFAMIMGNTLYFAVDQTTRPKYEQMGSTCFSYATKKKRVEVKKYYEVPGDLLEDREQLTALAMEAVGVARRARA